MDWADFAAHKEWEQAIITFLRNRSRETVPLWTVINQIAAEAGPKSRRELRSLKMEILKAVGGLVRSRQVMRWRRTTLAILDLGQPTVPLEHLASLRQEQDGRVQ